MAHSQDTYHMSACAMCKNGYVYKMNASTKLGRKVKYSCENKSCLDLTIEENEIDLNFSV